VTEDAADHAPDDGPRQRIVAVTGRHGVDRIDDAVVALVPARGSVSVLVAGVTRVRPGTS
jgi:hypothetical protein